MPWRPSPIPRPAEPPVRVTSMEKNSTLRRNRIIPATTTTHGSLDQIPATDSPRRHRTDKLQSSMTEHEEAIRNFLSHVDRETGYIE